MNCRIIYYEHSAKYLSYRWKNVYLEKQRTLYNTKKDIWHDLCKWNIYIAHK